MFKVVRTWKKLSLGQCKGEEWEVQTTGCEVDYKDVFYNKRNIANIL